jgi:nucleotide-binding universal stress UspA family protein
MTYATLMVNLELGHSNAAVLEITAELAERFGAKVVGISGRQPLQMIYGDGYICGELFEQDCNEIAKELIATEAQFRAALRGRVATVEWRSTQTYAYLSSYLAEQARSADLIVTGLTSSDRFDASRTVNVGELIMQAGRPVLIVPKPSSGLKLERVLVAWKDTREARRAVCDALALLKIATHVSVVEIAAKQELAAAARRVNDVVSWLRRHDIKAEGSASISTGNDTASLYAICQEQDAQVVVAGAYGHSRAREWVLGGVTRDLLLSAHGCAFVSH